MIQAFRSASHDRHEKFPRAQKLVRSAGFPTATGIVAAIATGVFRGDATPESLNVGLVSLITVNAVIVGLTYATMQKAASLAPRTDETSMFALRVVAMVVGSMLGILFAIVHLIWSPDWTGFLPFTALLLVGSPAVLPMLAIQERNARLSETAEAAERLLNERHGDQEDGTTSGSGSDSPDLLRLRPTAFTAEPSDPFARDVLGREPQVKSFCTILIGIATPAVLSVDGGWGAGKTAFVKMCTAWMRSASQMTNGVSVVEFNAWTQSHTGNPLRDMVAAVTDQITGSDTQRRRQIAEVLRRQADKLASDGLMDDAVYAVAEGPQRELGRFEVALRRYVSDCGGRLVVFIDELDRCRPDYALGVLENVRHLFDVDGVIVVLAVNSEALDYAVGASHGPPDKSERYLRRFVDQATRLPDPDKATLDAFVDHLCDKTGLEGRLKRDSYTRHILEVLIGLAEGSLRDLEQAVHRVLMVFASIPRSSDDPHDNSNPMWAWEQAAMTLMVLRELDREAYRKFTSRQIDSFAAAQALRASPIEIEPIILQRMEILLLMGKFGSREPILNAEFWDQYDQAGRSQDGAAMQELYRKFLGMLRLREHDIAYLSGLIEMTHFEPSPN